MAPVFHDVTAVYCRQQREREREREDNSWENDNYVVVGLQAIISLSEIQGTTGGCGLGGACSHIKAYGLSPAPHQRLASPY